MVQIVAKIGKIQNSNSVQKWIW